jgi:uncharacterized membrane protein
MIFISHAAADNAWCRDFAGELQGAGHAVWYDESVLRGDTRYLPAHQRELQRCEVLVVVLTPEAWLSPLVQDDIHLALAEQRPIVSLILEPTDVTGFLLIRPWLDVSERAGGAVAREFIAELPALLAAEPTEAFPLGYDQRQAAAKVYLSWPIVAAQALLRQERHSRFVRFHAMQALLCQWFVSILLLITVVGGVAAAALALTPLRTTVSQDTISVVLGTALLALYVTSFVAMFGSFPLSLTRAFILSGRPIRMPGWALALTLGMGLLWVPLIALCGGKNGRLVVLAPIADALLNRRDARARRRAATPPSR